MKRGADMKQNEKTNSLLVERFSKDSLIALATVEDGFPMSER